MLRRKSPTPPQSNTPPCGTVWCSHKVLQSDLIPLVSPLLATQFQDEGRGIKPSARIRHKKGTARSASCSPWSVMQKNYKTRCSTSFFGRRTGIPGRIVHRNAVSVIFYAVHHNFLVKDISVFFYAFKE